MRTWRLLFAAGILAALLVPATGASAKPHETAGNLHTECVVDGSVTLTPGVSLTPTDGHYEFEDTSLECVGQEEGVYEVFASGDTTDFWHEGDGETCAQGGSSADGNELHTGVLDAFQGETQVFEGHVHFARLGEAVLADGPLTKLSDSTPHFFQAELVFQPTEGDCTTAVTAASLTGTGEIYGEPFVHDCTQDLATDDPHCDTP